MDSKTWLEKVVGEPFATISINAVALKSGIPQTTLNGRIKNTTLTAEHAISISRAYRYDVVQALLELGFITKDDLKTPQVRAALADATDRELVEEIGRRLAAGSATTFDQPIPIPARASGAGSSQSMTRG